MSLSFILSLVGPLAVDLIKAVFSRIMSHGVSTGQGVGFAALLLAFLNSIGCDLTAAQQGVVGGITALPGLLGTDAGTTAKSFLQVATETAMRAKTAAENPPEKKS